MSNIINDLLIGLNSVGKVFCNYASGVFIQSAVLVVVLFVIDLLLRKRVRAVFRYCIWLLILVKLVLPPTFSFPTGIYYWAPDNLSITLPSSERTFEIVEMESMGEYRDIPDVLSSEAIVENAQLIANAEQDLIPLTWQAVVLVLWLFGVLAFLLVLAQRLKFVRGLVARSSPASDELLALLEECRLQMNLRQKIRLQLSEAVSSPAVCGLFTPVVLMPANLVNSLSPEGLRSTLIHELAHIKRLDLWINFVQTVLQVVYFYNPFVWFANAVIRKVCEEAVDETVLVTLGGQADDYSNALIDIGEIALWKSDLGMRLIGVLESKKALQWRIKHMLNRPVPKSAKLGALGITALLVTAAVLLPMAKAERSTEPNEFVNIESEVESVKSLHEAAADGDLERVKILLDGGAEVNAKDVGLKATPLHWAARRGHQSVVNLLLARGAEPDLPDPAGETPLHWAAGANQTGIMELLISVGATIDKPNNEGNTPLFAAISGTESNNYIPAIAAAKLLIANGANVSPFHWAAFIGDTNMLQEVLKQGQDVDARAVELDNCTVLHLATQGQQEEIIKLILGQGANVDAKSRSGDTALHIATAIGRTDLAQLLIEHGADLSLQNPTGGTPLHYASYIGHANMAKLLIDSGAEVNAKTQPFGSPLDWVFLGAVTEVFTKQPDISSANLSPEVEEQVQRQMRDRVEVVKVLVSAGADPNGLGSGTLAMIAAWCPYELVELLIAHGLDANAVMNPANGLTLLHVAARSGQNDIVELLIAKGADVNVKDARGLTPLVIAKRRGNTEIIEMLTKAVEEQKTTEKNP